MSLLGYGHGFRPTRGPALASFAHCRSRPVTSVHSPSRHEQQLTAIAARTSHIVVSSAQATAQSLSGVRLATRRMLSIDNGDSAAEHRPHSQLRSLHRPWAPCVTTVEVLLLRRLPGLIVFDAFECPRTVQAESSSLRPRGARESAASSTCHALFPPLRWRGHCSRFEW